MTIDSGHSEQEQRQQQQTALAVNAYCHRLSAVLDLSAQADRRLLETLRDFRDACPEKFKELARVHLSFLVDLPHFDGDASSESECQAGRRRRRVRHQLTLPMLLSAGKRRGQPTTAAWHVIADRVCRLIGHLLECERYKVEGLFRKTGHCGRQKELRRLLLADGNCCLSNYTVHDVASVIKLLLRTLEEPMISDSLMEILTAIAELCSRGDRDGKRTESEEQILRCRQLKAVRIFALLLPQRVMAFVTRLLHFLRTVAACPETRMTSASLGTVFGPVLFCPKSMEAAACQKKIGGLNRLSAFLIDNCHRINEIPRSFADDLGRNWRKLGQRLSESSSNSATPPSRRSASPDDDSVDTGVQFSEHRPGSSASDYGQRQLAELYAHIRRLPESKEKRRLEKRFNHHLLCCTPDRQFSFRKRLHRTAGARSLTRLSDDVNACQVEFSTSRTPVGRFFGRDRRLMRALSSIRVYKCCQEMEGLKAKLSFDCWSDERQQQQQQQQPSKKRRLSACGSSQSLARLRISSPKLVFSDSANASQRVSLARLQASAPSPRLVRATRFLETAL